MAYATTNPPILATQCIGFLTGARTWMYASADASTVVDGDGYFTNADALGMKAGDEIRVIDTDTNLTTTHVVLSVTSGGAADLGDGTTTGDSTDSD